jgi:hypothetical protein
MNKKIKDALDYHEFPFPGKLSVNPSKPCDTADDLALAYTPGVAEPVLAIAKDPSNAYRYTNKGNLVAVITDGSAVLGLGNVGALAGKPVMEGKGVLFKRFADIDVYDIEIDCSDPDEFIQTVVNIAPTFGGINLEDIAAPHCFYIESELKRRLDIPVFHDDQHGTAIISTAGIINALDITGKKISDVKVVVNGAGAAGIACLWGPAHGGANQACLEMLNEIGTVERIPEFIARAKDKNDPFRLMGFGHRVYKNIDPRATVLKQSADEVLELLGVENNPILQVAKELEAAALTDPYFAEKKLFPNVDFYSGIILEAMGFPISMFTPIFALSRTVGWISQWKEMISDPTMKIGRPRQLYCGEVARDYVDVEKR